MRWTPPPTAKWGVAGTTDTASDAAWGRGGCSAGLASCLGERTVGCDGIREEGAPGDAEGTADVDVGGVA